MRCPLCQSETTETVVDSEPGMRRITRACSKGHRFGTVEVLTSVASRWSGKAISASLETALRGMRRRAEAQMRRDTVQQLAGLRSATEIARFLGITETRVRQLADEVPAPSRKAVVSNILRDD